MNLKTKQKVKNIGAAFVGVAFLASAIFFIYEEHQVRKNLEKTGAVLSAEVIRKNIELERGGLERYVTHEFRLGGNLHADRILVSRKFYRNTSVGQSINVLASEESLTSTRIQENISYQIGWDYFMFILATVGLVLGFLLLVWNYESNKK